jgi:signal transduction histidine kinase
MAIVHRIIEAHGGTIEAVKNEPPGAEFVLHVPIGEGG